MADGYILLPNEQLPDLRVLLPRGVSVLGSEPWGGAMRVTISGNQIAAGANYQFVIVDADFSRSVSLVKDDAPSIEPDA